MTYGMNGIDSGNKKAEFAATGRKLAAVAVLGAVAVAVVGCRKDMAAVQQAPIVDGNAANDPANANMAQAVAAPGYDAAQAARNGYAPVTRVAGESYSQQPQGYAETYPAQDSRQTRNEAYNYNTQASQGYGYGDDDQLYSDLLDPNVPVAQQAPPPLPEYAQPVAPGPDYLWTPGYWDYANTGYYYVPGNWVSAPFAGALWTPGWWGYGGGGYRWHRGYWGRHVGYYGGINYGFGFIGFGYQGGYWNNDHFYYNRDANHVDPRVVNNYVYQRNMTVVNNSYVNNSRTSYFGGPGGLQRRPQPMEVAAQRETHIAPLQAQVAERQAASQNRQQFFSSNGGRPQQMFAAHPVIERNVNVPAQLARPQQAGALVQQGGFNAQRQTGAPAMQPQTMQLQRGLQQQAENQQRQQKAEAQQQQRVAGQQAMQQRQVQQQAVQHQAQQQAAQQQARQQANVQNQQRAEEQNQQRMAQQAARQNQAVQQQHVVQQQQMQQRAAEQQRVEQQQVQQRSAQQAQQQHAVQQQQQMRAVQQQGMQQRAVPQQRAPEPQHAAPQAAPRAAAPAPAPHAAAAPPPHAAAPPAPAAHEHGH